MSKMPSRETFKSLCICGAFLGLVAWNAVLQTNFREHERKLTTHESKLTTHGSKLTTHGSKLTTHDGKFKEQGKLIQSVDERSSRRMKRAANQSPVAGGATYIRWGRTVCPPDADLVYMGYAGGQHYTHVGGSAEYVCLTEDPKYGKFTSANEGMGWIYGVEIQLGGTSILETSNAQSSPLDNSDVRCAVCRSHSRSSMVMIPGTNQCSPGWTVEYWGYLMTGKYSDKAQHNYACLDKAPDRGTDGGARDNNGALMWHVQGACGSLPCGPYINYQELTCVVCTK